MLSQRSLKDPRRGGCWEITRENNNLPEGSLIALQANPQNTIRNKLNNWVRGPTWRCRLTSAWWLWKSGRRGRPCSRSGCKSWWWKSHPWRSCWTRIRCHTQSLKCVAILLLMSFLQDTALRFFLTGLIFSKGLIPFLRRISIKFDANAMQLKWRLHGWFSY